MYRATSCSSSSLLVKAPKLELPSIALFFRRTEYVELGAAEMSAGSGAIASTDCEIGGFARKSGLPGIAVRQTPPRVRICINADIGGGRACACTPSAKGME